MSTLIDLLASPWALPLDRLLELQAIYATHLRGDKIDLDALEARLGRPLANEHKAYALAEGTGVAVLSIEGVIAPKANLLTRVSGGAAASLLQQQVQSMAADPKVRAVVLDVDSPGGNVLGIPALATAVRALADAKPTVAVSTGNMSSAAYWIGSAANAVYLSGATDIVGSIGVVATHTYDPRRAERDGQRTEVVAGRYKRVASENAPLSAEGQAYLQASVDEIYRVFVEAVAAHRGASVEQVLEHMADGRTFIGGQAIAAGLADGIATVDVMVERLAADPAPFATRRRAVFAAAPSASSSAPAVGAAAVVPAPPLIERTVAPMTTPATPQALAAQFAAEHPEAVALLRAEGAAAERDRINAVRQQRMPGHDALIEQLAMDGQTTGPEAAVAVLAAERTARERAAAARAADAPAPVRTEAEPEGQPAAAAARRPVPAGYSVDERSAQLDARVRAWQAAHPGTDYLAALKAVTAQQPHLQGA